MALRITLQQLKEIMPRIPARYAEGFILHQGQLDHWAITGNVERFAMWIANVAHECGEFNTLIENGNYRAETIVRTWPTRFKTLAEAAPFAHNPAKLFNNVYANRMGNGPSTSGDGFRYRGRSEPQLTGKDGYRIVGGEIGIDLLANPDAANFIENMNLVGGAFWGWKNLNRLADTGNFYGVVARWNGGHIGMPARIAYYNKAKRVLASAAHGDEVPLPKPRPDAAPSLMVETAQQRLRELGYWPGNPNGDEGAMTRDAVLAFQADNALPLTGVVDAGLMEELAKAGPRYIPPERSEATEKTLKEKGSETVTFGARVRGWGKWLIGGGAAAAVGDNSSPLETAQEYVGQASMLRYIIDPLRDLWAFGRENIWLLLIIAGVVIYFAANRIIKARVHDEQTGANRGR